VLTSATVRPPLADIREKYYMQVERLDSFYFFRVDDCWIVDATKVCVWLMCLAVAVCCGVCRVTTGAEAQPGALHQPLVRPQLLRENTDDRRQEEVRVAALRGCQPHSRLASAQDYYLCEIQFTKGHGADVSVQLYDAQRSLVVLRHLTSDIQLQIRLQTKLRRGLQRSACISIAPS
jgi:hypothetical protein